MHKDIKAGDTVILEDVLLYRVNKVSRKYGLAYCTGINMSQYSLKYKIQFIIEYLELGKDGYWRVT